MIIIIEQFRLRFNTTVDQSQERGSVVVLVALALTALLGFCAIVTDVGVLYAKRVQLQNSVNAAALAGVQELPNSLAQAELKAEDYAVRNGVSAVTVNFGANNAKIIVQATQQVPTYFARIWGITENQISVSSKAMIVPVTAMTGAVPLCIRKDQTLQYGVNYTLKVGAGSGSGGWYGSLDFGDNGGGASQFRYDLTYGYQGTLSVGQSVNTQTGVESGPACQAVGARIGLDTRVPRNTFEDHDSEAAELMYIPIVITDSPSAVKIMGFAAFWIDSVTGNGTNSVINGRFLHQIAVNGSSNASLADLLQTEYDMEHGGVSTDPGVYSSKLVIN
ncbi:MAG TPA: pilus assembly protein TadG-related protein [Desulfosporosinus sp.]